MDEDEKAAVFVLCSGGSEHSVNSPCCAIMLFIEAAVYGRNSCGGGSCGGGGGCGDGSSGDAGRGGGNGDSCGS